MTTTAKDKPFAADTHLAIDVFKVEDPAQLEAFIATLPRPPGHVHMLDAHDFFSSGRTTSDDVDFNKTLANPKFNLYAVVINHRLEAFIPHSLEDDTLFDLWTFDEPFRQNPLRSRLHKAYARLARKLKPKTINFHPQQNHNPVLVMDDGTAFPPHVVHMGQALYGTVIFDDEDDDAYLDHACALPWLLLDVTNLQLEKLDRIKTVAGSIYSAQSTVLLRNLQHVTHLICPKAEILLSPALTCASGSIIGSKAKYVDLRALQTVGSNETHALSFPRLRDATFDSLLTVNGTRHVPALNGPGAASGQFHAAQSSSRPNLRQLNPSVA